MWLTNSLNKIYGATSNHVTIAQRLTSSENVLQGVSMCSPVVEAVASAIAYYPILNLVTA